MFPTRAQFEYTFSFDVPRWMLFISDKICHLDSGVPEIVAIQSSVMLVSRLGCSQPYSPKLCIVIHNGRPSISMRDPEIISEDQSWREGKDIFDFFVISRYELYRIKQARHHKIECSKARHHALILYHRRIMAFQAALMA